MITQFDRLWRKWLSITFGFTVLLSIVSAGFISYRAVSSADETRATLRQLLYTHLEKESPRIADELYLRLESLDQRERMLGELIGHYGTAHLRFERFDPPVKSDESADRPAWVDGPGESRLTFPVRFGDLSIGNLVTEVRWSSLWEIPSFRRGVGVSALLITLIVCLWAAIYRSMRKRIFVPAMQEFKERSSQEAFSRIAKQVAHDIRSPLAALSAIERDLQSLPEETRLIARSAVERIHDIANELLARDRLSQSPSAAPEAPSEGEVVLLPPLIDLLLTEKRLQYRSKVSVEIRSSLDPSSYGLFAQVAPSEFKRLLSNLIDNGVEALGATGRVGVRLSGAPDEIVLKIFDNGRGIPASLIPQLGERGRSFGKAGGSGLGLYHARTHVTEWGGSLEIESREHLGTTVTIRLPRAPTPSCFATRVLLAERSRVAVLDDDASIHQTWDGRLGPLVATGGITVAHFSEPESFTSWVRAQDTQGPVVYLVDYELIGHRETGLDLVESLGIAARSILVTSHFEEPRIRERCGRLGLTLIPKGMAGIVPIEVHAPASKWDAVLVDDDPIVRLSWKRMAALEGKKLLVLAGASELRPELASLEPSTPIYLDSHLGEATRGEELARELHAAGYSELYLVTGYEPDQFKGLTCVKGILGKLPPWGGPQPPEPMGASPLNCNVTPA